MKQIIAIILIGFISVNTATAQSNTEPTLNETLNWLRNKCLSYSDERMLAYVGQYSVGKPTDIVHDEASCSLTFIYAMKDWDNKDMTYRYSIYFSEMDGNTITWSQDYSNVYLTISSKSGSTCSWGYYHDGSGEGKKATLTLTFIKGTFQGETNLQERMTKAFRRAIVLCGGQFTNEKF